MHPWPVLLILVTAGVSAVYGNPAAAGTPAARFWEETLPGTPMPESIADLVQEGIDHSPLGASYSVRDNLASKTVNINWASKTVYVNWFNTGPVNYADLPAGLYLLEAQIHVGSTMEILFEPAAVSPILPHDVAQKVPFGNLTDALARFRIAPGSTSAAVGETISLCQAPAQLPGEQKACATSLEATVQSAMDILGTGSTQGAQGKAAAWAASSVLPRAGLPLQRYVVQSVAPLDDGDRHVGCHSLAYPYAVYYCHDTGSPTNAYVVSLRSLGGGGGAPQQLTMATICHLDTSKWDPEHPAFKMTNTHPGGEPVCHFMSYSNLLFGLKGASKP